MKDWKTVLWPVDRLPDALEQLAQRSGFGDATVDVLERPESAAEPSRIWMFALAARLGVELEPVVPLYRELGAVLLRAAPALLQVREDGTPRYLVLLGARAGKVSLLSTDSRVVTAARRDVTALLREEQQAKIAEEVDRLIADLQLPARQHEGVREKLLLQRLGQKELRTGWILRPTPNAPRATLLRGMPLLLGCILVNHVLLSAVLAGSFWILGRSALQAHLESGWFEGWIAIIALSIPLRLLEVWWQGRFAMRVGGLLKQQLLAGILKLTPDEIRLDGVGKHFGRVVESEVVELLALGGGLLAILSVVDVVIAGFVLARGAAGGVQVVALVLWTVVALWLAWRHSRAQRRWSFLRIDITHDLLERMVGHRTRLAQLPLERWHDGEDRRLGDYAQASRAMDVRTTHLSAILPAGWLVVGLGTLLPAFSVGRVSTSALAVSVGGIVLALRAFEEIAVSFQQLSLAAASFEQIRNLLGAVVRPELISRVPLHLEAAKPAVVTAGNRGSAQTLLEARGLSFRHQGRSRSVLDNCSLQIASGDRILLQGPSGGGKSTLVSLLTGIRTPDAGVLLLRGLDRATFGLSGWRRRVTAAPQFHENHILAGSFAYNLLLGREWPVSQSSREEAREICRELGLDELIAKMPSGLDEMIGETGWQLSHGEKSRLYIGRTLLQGDELVILDESFASLDPETMGVAVRCVLKHAPAVVVVSHP